MIWEFAAGAAVGLAVGEYYRRVVDRIRKEQLNELRHPVRTAQPDDLDPFEDEELFDLLDRPQKRRVRRPLVSPEQFDELKRTGSTAGKRVNGENVNHGPRP